MKSITITEFRNRPGYFFFRIQHDQQSYVIKSKGKPIAVIAPIEPTAFELGASLRHLEKKP